MKTPTTFARWIEDNPGMPTLMAVTLSTCKQTISAVKCRKQPIPITWVPFLVQISRGQLTYQSLVHEILAVSKKAR